MVANLTAEKAEDYEKAKPFISLAEKAQELKENLCAAVDEDTQAFNDYLDALRLPKKTDAERQAMYEHVVIRTRKEGLKKAVNVPLSTAKNSFEALKLATEITKTGNIASVSDAAVGAQVAFSGVIGGILNVLINLGEIKDAEFIEQMKKECETLRNEANRVLCEALDVALKRIEELWHSKKTAQEEEGE